jgi:hypothetical protein
VNIVVIATGHVKGGAARIPSDTVIGPVDLNGLLLNRKRLSDIKDKDPLCR